MAKITELTAELVETDKQIAVINEKITLAVAGFQTQLKTLQEKDAELRDSIKTAMENNKVENFENDIIKITYVKPSSRTTLDTAKIKEEAPEVYEKFSKVSEVKASVRIKVKEIENA